MNWKNLICLMLSVFLSESIYADSIDADRYIRKAEYYQKKADVYRREAAYYLKMAEGYQPARDGLLHKWSD